MQAIAAKTTCSGLFVLQVAPTTELVLKLHYNGVRRLQWTKRHGSTPREAIDPRRGPSGPLLPVLPALPVVPASACQQHAMRHLRNTCRNRRMFVYIVMTVQIAEVLIGGRAGSRTNGSCANGSCSSALGNHHPLSHQDVQKGSLSWFSTDD